MKTRTKLKKLDRVSVQTHIAKRCDVGTKTKTKNKFYAYISAQANLPVKRTGRSQNED